jgi:hypothetical protein
MTAQEKNSLQNEMHEQLHDHKLFEQAKTYAFAYLDELEERSVYPTDVERSLLLSLRPGGPGKLTKKCGSRGSGKEPG